MKHHLQNLVLPPFEPFIVTPNNPDCPAIDPRGLIIEILWGAAQKTSLQTKYSQNSCNIEGSHALIFRYRRDQKAEPRVASILSFDVFDEDGVEIVQLQWTTDRHVGYRFNSSFQLMGYVLSVMEKTFLASGVPVRVVQFPTGIEWASYAAGSIVRYEILRTAMIGKMIQYNLLTRGE
jgi:hypothetical protein